MVRYLLEECDIDINAIDEVRGSSRRHVYMASDTGPTVPDLISCTFCLDLVRWHMSPLGSFARTQGSGAISLHEGHRCPRHELRTCSYRAVHMCYRDPETFFCTQDNKTAYQLAKDKHKHLCVQFLKSWYDTSQVRYQTSHGFSWWCLVAYHRDLLHRNSSMQLKKVTTKKFRGLLRMLTARIHCGICVTR